MTYFMITNRNQILTGNVPDLGAEASVLTYWTAANPPLGELSSWTNVGYAAFRKALLGVIATFPAITDPNLQEDQKHLTLLIHGYNNTWKGASELYQSVSDTMYGPVGLGQCIFFTWPSWGSPAMYLPDRAEARDSADALATVLLGFYDLLEDMQANAAATIVSDLGLSTLQTPQPCYTKFSVICHSMGNYVLQNAMRVVWLRKNQPLLVSLINQLLMVAADVDNDLFKSGENVQNTDGDAIANLTYRVTALYTGLDQVLGLSAGLKHFGKRRLGRSGLDKTYPVSDNVWDIDCTSLFVTDPKGLGIHGMYFSEPKTIDLMRQLLRGVDRQIVMA